MADSAIADFADGVTAAATDRIAAARSPFGAGDDVYLTPAYIKDYILALANTWQATQTITPAVNTNALAVTGYSLTGANAQSLIDLAGTWNTSGAPTAFKLNVTDTASDAASLLVDIQKGGSSKFSVAKGGKIEIARWAANNGSFTMLPDIGGKLSTTTGLYFSESNSVGIITNGTDNFWVSNSAVIVDSAFSIGWSASSASNGSDTRLFRDAANTPALRNGTAAQTFNIYNTYTDASNWERGGFTWVSNALEVFTQNAGTGSARALVFKTKSSVGTYIGTNDTLRWEFSSAGHMLAFADNTYDIGASGATRPRDLYLARSLAIEATITAGATTGNQTINKAAGTVNFAAAATTLTVTNSLVTTNSLIFCDVRTNDMTATIKNVVSGSGSFVITLNAAATAETSVGFFVVQPD